MFSNSQGLHKKNGELVTKPDGTIYNVYGIQDNAKYKEKSQAYPPSGPRSGGQFFEMRGNGFPDFNSNVSEKRNRCQHRCWR